MTPFPMKPHWPRRFQLHVAHLEARDAYAENLVAYWLQSLHPHGHGIVEMALDDEELGRGELVFRRLKAIFPSGILVDQTGMVPLERNASTMFPETGSMLPVFVGIPKVGLGSNVSAGDGLVRSVRYIETGEGTMRPQPEILFGGEPMDRFEVLFVGHLQRIGNRLRFDPAMFPTILRIRAAAELDRALTRFIASLERRRDELRNDRGNHPLDRDSLGTPEAREPMELGLLLREHLPLLTDCAREDAHPRELYELLNAFYGALRIFGAKEERPRYSHTKLSEIFPWFFRRIQTIVEEAARDETTRLEFVRVDPVTFDLSFQSDDLVGKRPFLVADRAPEHYLRGEVPRLLKMAGPTEIGRLKASAVRGVAIVEEFEPPGVLATRRDVVVYRIHVRDPLWLDIEDRKRVLLFLPGAPPGVRFFLYGVKRAF
ncbi:type VI secretion system baseplate subunit TssK [Pendulispora albinea]|uniref:Type VI secretion system baseplate subunit TssK n=1 Tax=Pendulispora albinea TaxID=2741071 RepID=A0ABZ2LSP7_9BACT